MHDAIRPVACGGHFFHDRCDAEKVSSSTIVGVALGLAGGLGAVRVAQTLLFGISPVDPISFAAAVAAILVVAVASASIPARRATKVDPMIALRAD